MGLGLGLKFNQKNNANGDLAGKKSTCTLSGRGWTWFFLMQGIPKA